MSYLDKLNQAVTAAAERSQRVGTGANKGFWQQQLRDDDGTFMDMGRGFMFDTIGSDGSVTPRRGIFFGADLKNRGNANFLVKETDGTKNVYSVPSYLARPYKAGVSTETLKRQGVQKKEGGKIGDNVAGMEAYKLKADSVRPATAEDERLAAIVPDKEQQKLIDEARANSPLADAPAGAERDMAPESAADAGVKPASLEDAAAKLWNDSVYGDGADLDNAVKAIQTPPSSPGFDVVVKEAKDLQIGDEIVDANNKPVGRITGDVTINGKRTLNITTPSGKKGDITPPPNDKIGVAVPKKTAAPVAPTAPKKAAAKKTNTPTGPTPMTNKQVDQLDGFADQIAKSTSVDPQLKQDYLDFMARNDNAEDISSDEAKNMIDRLSAAFQKPVTPKKAPTVRAPKKKAPAAPAAPGPISERTPAEQALRDSRKDMGEDIAPVDEGMDDAAKAAFQDEMFNMVIDPLIDPVTGKRLRDPLNPKKLVNDQNAIIDKLLEKFPNAKVNDNDKVIVERQDWTDPVSGKDYQYEVSIERTVGNQFIQRYKFTDKATGEVSEWQYKDFKDSMSSIFGKTNGVLLVRDYLLGRKMPGKEDRAKRTYFGPKADLKQRVKFFRGATAEGNQGDLKNYRLLTFEEAADFFLEGGERILNKSEATKGGQNRSQFGNVLVSARASAWDAIDAGDTKLAREIVLQHLGRVADNPEDIKRYLDYMRAGIKKRYAKAPVKQKQAGSAILTEISRYVNAKGRNVRDDFKQTYVSADGVTTLKKGDKVIYENTEGITSVGTITEMIPASGPRDYNDTVTVQFADRSVSLLQTRNMYNPASNPKRFGDPAPTDYTPNVTGADKIKARAAELGINYDIWANRSQDAKTAGIPLDLNDGSYSSLDVTTPYLGSQGNPGTDATAPDATAPAVPDATAPTEPAVKLGNVNNLQYADDFYSADGELLGTISEIAELESQDGGQPALVIYYIDENGNENYEVVTRDEDRGPK